MEKLNKLSLPVTILIGCVILGGFYYVTQVSKQKSIERQQLNERLEEQRIRDAQAYKESSDRLSKMFCVDEATQAAQDQYKSSCNYDCKEGYYYIANYDNYYNSCLQRKGLK